MDLQSSGSLMTTIAYYIYSYAIHRIKGQNRRPVNIIFHYLLPLLPVIAVEQIILFTRQHNARQSNPQTYVI